jgi:hypothetical protein
MNALTVAIIGAVAGSLAAALLTSLVAPIGRVRPFSIAQATLTETGGGLDLTVAIRNRRFRVKQELSGLLLLEIRPSSARPWKHLRHPWRWIRYLPGGSSSYLLVGADMGRIRNHSFVIDGRGSTTVRASVQDTRGKPYPLDDLSADICVVAYPPGAAPSKRRPARVKMPS